jgi:hypothetical protein
MKTSDEELWKQAGLFEQVDALSNLQRTFPPLPSFQILFLNQCCAPCALIPPLPSEAIAPSIAPPVPPLLLPPPFLRLGLIFPGQDFLAHPLGCAGPPTVERCGRQSVKLLVWYWATGWALRIFAGCPPALWWDGSHTKN